MDSEILDKIVPQESINCDKSAEEKSTEDFEKLVTKSKSTAQSFKKPVFVGKIGGKKNSLKSLPTKNTCETDASSTKTQKEESETDKSEQVTQKSTDKPKNSQNSTGNNIKDNKRNWASLSPAQKISQQNTPLPYKEPPWSGLPSKKYSLDVLKSGSIIANIDLNCRTFHTFGRSNSCDMMLEHLSISRYHAVIQYRVEASDDDGVGYYLYDLGSSYGTYLNKNRCYPKVYYRIRVGHVIKFGVSSRLYILQVS